MSPLFLRILIQKVECIKLDALKFAVNQLPKHKNVLYTVISKLISSLLEATVWLVNINIALGVAEMVSKDNAQNSRLLLCKPFLYYDACTSCITGSVTSSLRLSQKTRNPTCSSSITRVISAASN